MMNKRVRIIHPYLFALFPILSLYSQNIDSYLFSTIFLPSAMMVLLTLALWGLARIIFRDWQRAALVVSLFWLLLFSYGHCFNAIRYYFVVRPFTFGTGIVLAPTFSIVFAVAVYLVTRVRRRLSIWTAIVNIIAVALISIPSLTTIAYFARPAFAESDLPATLPGKLYPPDSLSPANYPDIYYLVPDEYARADILHEQYHYDNLLLLQFLQEKGFYIIPDAYSNYFKTGRSLASSLNMRFLDAEGDRLNPESADRTPLAQLIRHNAVFDILKKIGYTTIALSTGYNVTEIRDADIFLEPATDIAMLDEFQHGLLNTTPFPNVKFWLMRVFPSLKQIISEAEYGSRRRAILHAFEQLKRIPRWPGPKFVFAHVILPHFPYIFGPNGEYIYPRCHALELPREEYVRRYADQAAFADRMIMETLDSILANSSRPPIIILQGDHDPSSLIDNDNIVNSNVDELLSILHAIHLPEGGATCLYPGMTPVNTFRAVFNHYFNAGFILLEDRKYVSSWWRPYEFFDVTDSLSAGKREDGQMEQ